MAAENELDEVVELVRDRAEANCIVVEVRLAGETDMLFSGAEVAAALGGETIIGDETARFIAIAAATAEGCGGL